MLNGLQLNKYLSIIGGHWVKSCHQYLSYKLCDMFFFKIITKLETARKQNIRNETSINHTVSCGGVSFLSHPKNFHGFSNNFVSSFRLDIPSRVCFSMCLRRLRRCVTIFGHIGHCAPRPHSFMWPRRPLIFLYFTPHCGHTNRGCPSSIMITCGSSIISHGSR